MDRDTIRGFAARTAQASGSGLIVILYELALARMNEARKAYANKDLLSYDRELKAVQRCIYELMTALDLKKGISYDLLSLYLYASKRVITAIMKRDPEYLKSAETVLKKLMEAFIRISETDKSGPLMRNSQQLYAGLTYGRGSLNETFIDPDSRSRGFIA
jgi:flagellar protein FliS